MYSSKGVEGVQENQHIAGAPRANFLRLAFHREHTRPETVPYITSSENTTRRGLET